MWRDLIFALRTLRRTPAFTAVAITSLSLGIGANTAMFSFVNAILLKQLPVPEPRQLVTFTDNFRGETSTKVWRLTTIGELAKQNSVFSGIFGRFAKPVNFSTGVESRWVLAELVTGQYFHTLQVKAAAGRLLTEADVRDAAANPACVLSYRLWQREFAGDRGTIGRTLFLNGHAYRVLGVTSQGFSGADMQHRFDLQIPATRIGDFMPAFGNPTGIDWLKSLSWLSPMARLKPGVTRVQAQAQIPHLLEQFQSPGRPESKRRYSLRMAAKDSIRCVLSLAARSWRSWPSSPWFCSSRAPIWRTCFWHGRKGGPRNLQFACPSAHLGST